MFSISFLSDRNDKKQKLLSTISAIQDGNRKLREKFIQENIPFIIKSASKTVGKYVDMDNGEEFSIALIAFNEAINNFDINRNDNFWYYSELIIKSKIIDNFRVNMKNSRVFPFTFFENHIEALEEKFYQDQSINMFEDVDTHDELELFKKNLEAYGIALDDLIGNTPKHRDSIKLYIKVARLILNDEFLYKKLIRKKTLPTTEIAKKIDLHPNSLRKNSKFIIAICLILKSNLDIMKSFIQFTEKGGSEV